MDSVRAVRHQASKIRDALVYLAKNSNDPIIKSEAESLAIHEIESFDFLLAK